MSYKTLFLGRRYLSVINKVITETILFRFAPTSLNLLSWSSNKTQGQLRPPECEEVCLG